MTPDISAIAQKYARGRSGAKISTIRMVIADAIEEATASLRAQLEERWIPISELPPVGEWVLALAENGNYEVVRRIGELTLVHPWECHWGMLASQFTHWQKISSPRVAQESPLNGKEGK